ncbi:WYL domain-containing protein [Bifidobacterium leontopitheci]|uniref:WYL domain-containing protein n=2 Tax=Bifidobacterium leontopitheci TaxID=2650774 RepID=A0A6I1GJU3_9BIFI|nr:WYL domain-containing protein [Bifidobacterium leontopitheci]
MPSPRKPYTSNAVVEILEILWQQTRTGHGLSTRQIHDQLKSSLGEFAPAIRTIRNQLKTLDGSSFLGREIHKLDPKNSEDDASEMNGATDPQPGWRMSTFFDSAEARLLSDSLALSRIANDAMGDMVSRLNELVGGITLSNDYLTTTNARDQFNGEFLSTIRRLNDAISDNRAVTFHYMNYNEDGQLEPRTSASGAAPREYHVDPYQMVFKNGRYYLICALHGNEEARRIFCVDRITDIAISNDLFHPPKSRFDAIEYMRERPYPVTDDAVDIVMAARPTAFNYIFEWFDEPIITPEKNGVYKVTVKAPIKAAYWWALQYADAQVEIKKPPELRQQLKKAGVILAVKYKFTGTNHAAQQHHADQETA